MDRLPDRELLQLFDASARRGISNGFKPIGHFEHRDDADRAAAGMARQMPWTTWESCLVGRHFAIRRTR